MSLLFTMMAEIWSLVEVGAGRFSSHPEPAVVTVVEVVVAVVVARDVVGEREVVVLDELDEVLEVVLLVVGMGVGEIPFEQPEE